VLNIVGKRYWFFGLSLLLIVPGIAALAVWGLPLAIDFTGGSLLEVRFEGAQAPAPAQVVDLYMELGYGEPLVQSAAQAEIIARSRTLDESERAELVRQMQSRFGGTVTVASGTTSGQGP